MHKKESNNSKKKKKKKLYENVYKLQFAVLYYSMHNQNKRLNFRIFLDFLVVL